MTIQILSSSSEKCEKEVGKRGILLYSLVLMGWNLFILFPGLNFDFQSSGQAIPEPDIILPGVVNISGKSDPSLAIETGDAENQFVVSHEVRHEIIHDLQVDFAFG